MSIAKYKTGYRAERRAKEQMEEWDYLVVRSAASKSPFDLVGIGKAQFLLVQVKVVPHGKVYEFQPLKKKLAAIPVPANCKVELWVWEKRRGFHYFPI